MTVDDIIGMWNIDAQIHQHDLGSQARDIPKLHAKYIRIWHVVKRDLGKAVSKMKQYKALKREFIINPNKEDVQQYGWQPPGRKILKNEVDEYMESDNEYARLQFIVSELEAKYGVINEIIKQINNRNWYIKSAIEDRAFLAGE